MSTNCLSFESIYCQGQILSRQSLTLSAGKITQIEPAASGVQCLPGTLVPGFIDVQVNGGGGVLFNQSPDVATLQSIARAHQRHGTTAWLPTLISDSIDKMQRAAEAVIQARKRPELGVVGIHFEGPGLSLEKKGVHNRNKIRPLGPDELSLFKRANLGKVLVTVAPEQIAPEQIAELVAAGVIVSLGHSNATFAQTNAALAAGASGITHLFNAMSQFSAREPGMVGAALRNQQCYCGIIVDGVHVHPATVAIACQQKDKMLLITDAMPPAASPSSAFKLDGKTIKRQGNQLTNEQGRLAGSVLTMAQAVRNCQLLAGLTQSRAIDMASRYPAAFLGLSSSQGELSVGLKANMVLLDDSGEVTASWLDGQRLF